MKTQHIMAVCLALAIGFIAASFTPQPQENKVYEYMSLYFDLYGLGITSSNGEFESIKMKGSFSDFSPVLIKVNQYSQEGWLVVSSNSFGTGSNSLRVYFLLRREKK